MCLNFFIITYAILITVAKRKEKEKKETGKANKSRRSLSRQKTQNFDFCACPSRNVVKRDASERKALLSGYKIKSVSMRKPGRR